MKLRYFFILSIIVTFSLESADTRRKKLSLISQLQNAVKQGDATLVHVILANAPHKTLKKWGTPDPSSDSRYNFQELCSVAAVNLAIAKKNELKLLEPRYTNRFEYVKQLELIARLLADVDKYAQSTAREKGERQKKVKKVTHAATEQIDTQK